MYFSKLRLKTLEEMHKSAVKLNEVSHNFKFFKVKFNQCNVYNTIGSCNFALNAAFI